MRGRSGLFGGIPGRLRSIFWEKADFRAMMFPPCVSSLTSS